MHNKCIPILAIAVLTLLNGCSHGTFSGHKDMDSVGQWNVLANDVANRINKELMQQKYLHASVYVQHACGNHEQCSASGTSSFDQGFNDLLTTQLTSFGVKTVATPENDSLRVEYKVQAIYHPSEWQPWNWPKPGMLTAIAAGITVVHDAPWEIIPLAGAIDTFRANYRPSGHYEVIITTSIIDQKRYVMRTSDIYYINNADYWQYQQSNPAAEIQLTGAGAPSQAIKTRSASM